MAFKSGCTAETINDIKLLRNAFSGQFKRVDRIVIFDCFGFYNQFNLSYK